MYRHVKENDYIFTMEAYNEYNLIKNEDLDSFWRHFESEKFIDTGYIIMTFMMEIILRQMGYDVEEYNVEYNIEKTYNMEYIFDSPTYYVYNGKKYDAYEDLERAETIFAKYEDKYYPDCGYFGRDWFRRETIVHKILLDLIGFRRKVK